MHWLFFDSESARKLDEAGFFYDSTFGYNETVGYRAGTTQGFRPFGTKCLLELPLHVMDTALFYPSHLHFSEEQAMTRVNGMVDDMRQFGGALVINWHDRSIAPERLWDDFYVQLVAKLKATGAWFCTASQAAACLPSVCCDNGHTRFAKKSPDGWRYNDFSELSQSIAILSRLRVPRTQAGRFPGCVPQSI